MSRVKFSVRLNPQIFIRIESCYLDYFSFVSVSQRVTLNKPRTLNKPPSKNRYLFSSHRGEDARSCAAIALIYRETLEIYESAWPPVEIGLTFTAINVVSNNATTEKAVTNVEIKGSERGKKGSGWQGGEGGGGWSGGGERDWNGVTNSRIMKGWIADPSHTLREGPPARASRIVSALFSSSTACYALLAETMSPEQIGFTVSLSNAEPFSGYWICDGILVFLSI